MQFASANYQLAAEVIKLETSLRAMEGFQKLTEGVVWRW